MARWNDMNQMQHVRFQPEVNSFTFQSSSVSYGGANGAFYTTSRTRRSGTDGVSLTYCWINYIHSSTHISFDHCVLIHLLFTSII